MQGIVGNLNRNDIVGNTGGCFREVFYQGVATDTAEVVVNNQTRQIAVHVRGRGNGVLTIYNPNEPNPNNRTSYYNGSEGVNITLPKERFVSAMVLKQCAADGVPATSPSLRMGDYYMETTLATADGVEDPTKIYTNLNKLNLDFTYQGDGKYIGVDNTINRISLQNVGQENDDSLVKRSQLRPLAEEIQNAGQAAANLEQMVEEHSQQLQQLDEELGESNIALQEQAQMLGQVSQGLGALGDRTSALEQSAQSTEAEISAARGDKRNLSERLNSLLPKSDLKAPLVKAEGVLSGATSVIAGAYVDRIRSDKSWRFPAGQIKLEKSLTLSGDDWVEVADPNLYKLFSHMSDDYQWKPFADTSVANSYPYKRARLILTNPKIGNREGQGDRYVSINSLYVQAYANSEQPKASFVSLYAVTYPNPNRNPQSITKELVSDVALFGSPKSNVAYFEPINWGSQADGSYSNYEKLIIEFRCKESTKVDCYFKDIRIFGDNTYSANLNLVKYDRAYEVREDGKSVSFQGDVYAGGGKLLTAGDLGNQIDATFDSKVAAVEQRLAAAQEDAFDDVRQDLTSFQEQLREELSTSQQEQQEWQRQFAEAQDMQLGSLQTDINGKLSPVWNPNRVYVTDAIGGQGTLTYSIPTTDSDMFHMGGHVAVRDGNGDVLVPTEMPGESLYRAVNLTRMRSELNTRIPKAHADLIPMIAKLVENLNAAVDPQLVAQQQGIKSYTPPPNATPYAEIKRVFMVNSSFEITSGIDPILATLGWSDDLNGLPGLGVGLLAEEVGLWYYNYFEWDDMGNCSYVEQVGIDGQSLSVLNPPERHSSVQTSDGTRSLNEYLGNGANILKIKPGEPVESKNQCYFDIDCPLKPTTSQ